MASSAFNTAMSTETSHHHDQQNVIMDQDYAIAIALQNELWEEAGSAHADNSYTNAADSINIPHRYTLTQAWKFVEAIMRLDEKSPRPERRDCIEPVGIDEMVDLAERMMVAQEIFRSSSSPVAVDLGYHYTQSKNLQTIRTDGLLSQKERAERNISMDYFNGATYGDGIYSSNTPTSYARYKEIGNIGLLVARLKGRELDFRLANNRFEKGRNNTIAIDDMFVVLEQRSQCLPLFSFPTELVDDADGLAMLLELQDRVQQVVDKFFNPNEKLDLARVSRDCQLLTALVSAAAVPVPPAGPAATAEQDSNEKPKVLQDSNKKPKSLPSLPCRLEYTAPDSLLAAAGTASLESLTNKVTTGTIMNTVGTSKECPICQCHLWERSYQQSLLLSEPALSVVVAWKRCGHELHQTCARQVLANDTRCPMCRVQLHQAPRGKMPSGTMSISIDKSQRCAGFESSSNSTNTLVIRYVIPEGIQKTYHEHPGRSHAAADRTAYLPNTAQGRQLLRRLIYAFEHGLTFTVGTSITSGKHDQVTWASIHHKTNVQGGIQNYGFPDENYFTNCNEELDNAGVPK